MDPKRLEAVKDEKFIYLTTIGRRTGKPHSVELWFAFRGGKIYLSHEGDYTDWMKNVARDSRVKARVGEIRFEGHARILGEGGSRELGKRGLYEKYYGPAAKEVIDDWFELSTLMELTPV